MFLNYINNYIMYFKYIYIHKYIFSLSIFYFPTQERSVFCKVIELRLRSRGPDFSRGSGSRIPAVLSHSREVGHGLCWFLLVSERTGAEHQS